MEAPRKPVLIYDGHCQFCCRWIERWREMTGDRVVYETSQLAAARFPGIPAADFDQSVQWIGTDGVRRSGAAAVLAALAEAGWGGRVLRNTYEDFPLFARATESAYRFVARNRTGFSWFTRILWGSDVRPPTYAHATLWYLRALALIYLIAFASYGYQAAGLVGSQGILPAADFFARVQTHLGSAGFWQVPSLLWWQNSDAALAAFSAAGVGVSCLLLAGVTPPLCLAFLWVNYLSLTTAGQVFYQFQWDNLLLEAGFLAIFLAPWTLRQRRPVSPPRVAHFLSLWLLFRLMFASGVVKLSSGDPTWLDGTALDFHYFTQPLPTPLAWFLHQAPAWFQKLSVRGMFFIELVLPFFLFLPRRPRLAAAAALAALQVVIALTGNYGFFNLLTLALCLLAVDDVVWRSWFRRSPPEVPSRFLPKIVLIPLAAALVLLSCVPLAGAFRRPWPALAPLAELYDSVAPFRTINGYGLFAVMTTYRTEIRIQGSRDGWEWKDYTFRWKPGDPRRPPPWVAPYMPRLDWQMWFAALGRIEQNPWFVALAQRILEGSPDVLGLLESNPFPEAPPRFVRAQTDQYTFTTAKERAETGAWWKTEPAGVYLPEASLR